MAIAYQLAALTWALAPAAEPIAAPATRAQGGATAIMADYAALLTAHLFGEAPEQDPVVVATVADAPDTMLSLTLTGILAKEGDPSGSVLIKNGRGEEKTYYVGQAIDGADGATLHSIYADRVLLDRGGRLETLRWSEDLSASIGAPMRTTLPQSQPTAASVRDVMRENAGRLADVFRATPHMQEGRVVGVRLNPGRDRATFDALGFQAGDVVTDVNGIALDDVSQGAEMFQALGESTTANVTVLRDGVPQVLVIDTTQLQGLQENRE